MKIWADITIVVMADNRYLPIFYIFHYCFNTFGEKYQAETDFKKIK